MNQHNDSHINLLLKILNKRTIINFTVLKWILGVTFRPEIEENDEKILEVTQDEVWALKKGVQKWAETKTDVKFENPNDFHVKVCPEIEKNYENILEASQEEVNASNRDQTCAKTKNVVNSRTQVNHESKIFFYTFLL